MARPSWNLLRLLLAQRPPGDAVDDEVLLARYCESNDAAAFELLVRRHADLVYGTCRRICRHEQDAEDAFQATFLVLARKARSVRRHLAGWLHRTASRAALRAANRKITRRETELAVEIPAANAEKICDLRTVLDAEIDKLPDRLRLAVLHCYVEGRTTEDAALALAVPRGTVLSRLSRAREILSERLTRRGVTAPLSALSATLATSSASANLISTASTITPVAGSAAELLSLEVLRMSAWKTTTALTAAMLLTAGIGTGIGISLGQGEKPEPVAAANAPQPEPPKASVKPAVPEKPKDTTEALATRERETKLKGLRNLAEEYEARLRKLQDVREGFQELSLQKMDPKVISYAITKLDAESLENEEKFADWNQKVSEAEEKLKVAKNYKPSEEEIQEQSLRSATLNTALREQETTQMKLRDLEKRLGQDHATTKTAREEYDGATKRVEIETAACRTLSEKNLIADRLKLAANEVESCRNGANNLKRVMAQKKNRRDQLVQQLLAALRDNGRTTAIDREYEQVQRMQDEVRRLLMMQEFGLIGDPTNTANERIQRELAELRDEVRRLKEKK